MKRFRHLVSAALLVACGIPPLATAAVLDSRQDGFTVENSIEVPVSACIAWRALVDDVGRWWPSDHTWSGDARNLSINARAGGCFCETAEKVEAQHMTVVYASHATLLRMVGGLGPLQGMGLSGTLEWRFSPGADGSTKITLWYRAGGYAPDDLVRFAAVVDQVQAQQLGALGAFLKKGK